MTRSVLVTIVRTSTRKIDIPETCPHCQGDLSDPKSLNAALAAWAPGHGVMREGQLAFEGDSVELGDGLEDVMCGECGESLVYGDDGVSIIAATAIEAIEAEAP
jgi:hypothetical protein